MQATTSAMKGYDLNPVFAGSAYEEISADALLRKFENHVTGEAFALRPEEVDEMFETIDFDDDERNLVDQIKSLSKD